MEALMEVIKRYLFTSVRQKHFSTPTVPISKLMEALLLQPTTPARICSSKKSIPH